MLIQAAPTLFDRNEETHCREASIDETLCHRDPKCRYCPGYVGTNNRCVSPQQLEERPCESDVTQGMCPGVCASMTDCKSCLLFGDTLCGWCSATQTCQNLTGATNRLHRILSVLFKGPWITPFSRRSLKKNAKLAVANFWPLLVTATFYRFYSNEISRWPIGWSVGFESSDAGSNPTQVQIFCFLYEL